MLLDMEEITVHFEKDEAYMEIYICGYYAGVISKVHQPELYELVKETKKC